ncbi:hypothetical protein GCM10010389_52700 [Streptomyces echinoruber]|uniref:Uncharacterized protein n=1 Tax=Streptomyces echinoruber TaxID=68898 RepID=A0A918RRR9_9ACTN|nr:hypothetical protein GCM10010389_52700 [Streptomyces echinoruber]
MDVHGAAVADVVVAPDGGHQPIARLRVVGTLNEMRQQLELQVNQVEFTPFHFGGTACGIDADDVMRDSRRH